MFPFSVRIVVILLCLCASGYRFYEGKETWILYLAAGLLFIYEHFKGGSIWLAFQAYRKGKPEWVRKLLRSTTNPNWLRPSSRAYYYYLMAVVNTVDNELKKAKENLLLAIELPFATEHLRCLAHCFLGEVFLDLGEVPEGKKYYELANEIKHRQEIDPMIEKLGKRVQELA